MTVRTPSASAKPRKSVPTYATVIRARRNMAAAYVWPYVSRGASASAAALTLEMVSESRSIDRLASSLSRPKVPLYSCASVALFPDNAAAVRKLAAAAKASGLSIFGRPPFANLDHELGTPASVPDAPACHGHLDAAKPLSEAPAYTRVTGWLFDPATQTSPRLIRFISASGLVEGFALTGATDITEARHDFLLEHRTELERGAGQHHEGLAVAMIEDAGRGAARVGQGVAADGHVALAEVGGRDLAADELETFAQRLLVYWAALTLGPLAVGVSLSVTSYALWAGSAPGVRATVRSRMTGNARARNGSIQIVSPLRKLRIDEAVGKHTAQVCC